MMLYLMVIEKGNENWEIYCCPLWDHFGLFPSTRQPIKFNECKIFQFCLIIAAAGKIKIENLVFLSLGDCKRIIRRMNQNFRLSDKIDKMAAYLHFGDLGLKCSALIKNWICEISTLKLSTNNKLYENMHI